MAHLLGEIVSILSGVTQQHQDSDCACSRAAHWLSLNFLSLADTEQASLSIEEYRSLPALFAHAGAGLLSGSHSLEAQKLVVGAFEQ